MQYCDDGPLSDYMDHAVLPKQNKMSAFRAQNSNTSGHIQITHTILKRQIIWGTFLFFIFSMVWGQFLTMPHTRLSWILGMKSRHFNLLW